MWTQNSLIVFNLKIAWNIKSNWTNCQKESRLHFVVLFSFSLRFWLHVTLCAFYTLYESYHIATVCQVSLWAVVLKPTCNIGITWDALESTNTYWYYRRLSGQESACQCRRWGFSPWVGKISRRRKWQPTPVFLPEKSHGQWRLAGFSPWDCKRVGHNFVTKQQLILQIRM